MRDISVRAGVSRSTVSFVLNGKHSIMGVNEETRLRVLRTAEELGYRRNELARAVVTGKNRVFGFVVRSAMLESEVVARVLGGVMDEAEASHFAVQMIRLSGGNDEEIIRRCVELRPTGVMGIFVALEMLQHLQQEMARFHIPVAVLDSVPPLEGGSRIVSDDIEGCRQAIDHLQALGHTRIAYIGGGDTVVGRLREEGYRQAMAERGLPIPPGFLEMGKWLQDQTEMATRRLFQDRPLTPTAVFCADDKTAMVTTRTLRQMGLTVPGDVSVVGFANLVMAAYNDPPLTTIAQPFHEMGRSAVRRLLCLAEKAEQGEDISATYDEERLPTKLIVRQSTAPLQG
ncbi:MAG: LacI family DNA-binding transcriptional regulator [Armatimonadota bacterium]